MGAGAAGLTAAYELVHKTGIKPIVIEMSGEVGGLAKTISYKGNRMDIGGHRFFSKSQRVMDWWLNILPLQKLDEEENLEITYQRKHREVVVQDPGPDPDTAQRVMLVRRRQSRILFLRSLFAYPLRFSFDTLAKLGPLRVFRILFSYLRARLLPLRNEKSLEDFFINRFGRELYRTFFKSYTEKVWGLECSRIKPEWGAQRVRALSLRKVLTHAIRKMFRRPEGILQHNTQHSLIEKFLYPKYGPGQMWEEVAALVKEKGGEIRLQHSLKAISCKDGNVMAAEIEDLSSKNILTLHCDYFISSMPVKELIQAMGADVPQEVQEVAAALEYRDFITVGLLLNKLNIKNKGKQVQQHIDDNWIYIQEPDVKLGRLQVYNNWSPYMLSDPQKVWLGLEYFCRQGDEIWNLSDDELKQLGAEELEKTGLALKQDVLDGTVIRMLKAYPSYHGSYDRLKVVFDFVKGIENMFLTGRNGMHRYNNQDHSMLTAMLAVENIITGRKDKSNIMAVNADDVYHEA